MAIGTGVIHVVVIALCIVIGASGIMADGPPKVKAEQFIVPTREAFLRGLKLDKAELAEVKATLDKGDIEAAGKTYIAYFRTKETASLLLIDWAGRKRSPDRDTVAADLSDIPAITAETADGATTWLLPIKDATLRFATSIDHCSVQQ